MSLVPCTFPPASLCSSCYLLLEEPPPPSPPFLILSSHQGPGQMGLHLNAGEGLAFMLLDLGILGFPFS